MQKTIAQLQADNISTFGNGKDTRGDDEKTFNSNQLDSLKPLERVISAGQTAILGESYVVVADAEFTDPTPAEGKGFSVFIRNGTATVGGVDYDQTGAIINRIYHSGSWKSYPIGLSGYWEPTYSGFDTASNIKCSYSVIGSRVLFNVRFDCNVSSPLVGIITAPSFLPMKTGDSFVCSGTWVNRSALSAGIIDAYVEGDGIGAISFNIVSIENPTDLEISISGSYELA